MSKAKTWTKEDKENLLKLMKQGKTAKQIGEEIGRSEQSIRLKANKMGYNISDFHKSYDTKVVCENCNKEFDCKSYEERKFCSQSCAAETNNKLHPKRPKHKDENCIHCGQQKKNGKKFCSITCQHSFKRKKRIESNESVGPVALKNYLLETRGRKCEVCLNARWNLQPIPIEMDHINGDPYDNSLENVRLICPNCHAQTSTYKGKNAGNGRHERRERYKNGQSY